MTRNTNFDDVRVGTVVGFAHPAGRGIRNNAPYLIHRVREYFIYFNDDNHDCRVVSFHERWMDWGGYIISQPDETQTEQPPARTDTERLDWLIRNTRNYYGIPGFGPVSGRTVQERIKDCRAAIDAAMDREARG